LIFKLKKIALLCNELLKICRSEITIRQVSSNPHLAFSWSTCLCYLFTLFLSEMITDSQIENGLLKADLKDKVMYTLLRKHRHQTKKSNLRSLADIGKTVSSASRLFSTPDNGNMGASLVQLFLLFLFNLFFTFFFYSRILWIVFLKG